MLYMLLRRFGAIVRVTLGLHSQFQNSLNHFHVLVDDLPNREASQASGVQEFVDDTFWTFDQRFLGKPRVTLGDSIELCSIVTSPGPFQPEELDLPLKSAISVSQ